MMFPKGRMAVGCAPEVVRDAGMRCKPCGSRGVCSCVVCSFVRSTRNTRVHIHYCPNTPALLDGAHGTAAVTSAAAITSAATVASAAPVATLAPVTALAAIAPLATIAVTVTAGSAAATAIRAATGAVLAVIALELQATALATETTRGIRTAAAANTAAVGVPVRVVAPTHIAYVHIDRAGQRARRCRVVQKHIPRQRHVLPRVSSCRRCRAFRRRACVVFVPRATASTVVVVDGAVVVRIVGV